MTFVLPIIVAFAKYELAMTMHFSFAGSICVLMVYNRMTRSKQLILTNWLYPNGSNTHTRLYKLNCSQTATLLHVHLFTHLKGLTMLAVVLAIL